MFAGHGGEGGAFINKCAEPGEERVGAQRPYSADGDAMEIPKPAAEDWSWLSTENGFDHQEEPPEFRKKLDTLVLFLNKAFWHDDAAKPFNAHIFVAERFAKEFEKYNSSSDSSTKEACNLLKAAARLKDCDPAEITEIHMEAALKFFSAACTLQSCSSRVLEIKNAVGMFTDAARIFAHCAATSERCANIKVAALAYKCVEVTHFRILMLLRSNLPPPAAGDGCEPQNKKRRLDDVADKTLKSASKLRKLVDAAEHAEAAMDATSKCHRALESAAKDNSSSAEGFRSMTEAIEFSYYDVQGFIRLLRLALKNCAA
ncbi:unnamed protein product [Musa hybrid cultivar]